MQTLHVDMFQGFWVLLLIGPFFCDLLQFSLLERELLLRMNCAGYDLHCLILVTHPLVVVLVDELALVLQGLEVLELVCVLMLLSFLAACLFLDGLGD
jgi:hypothetical protein